MTASMRFVRLLLVLSWIAITTSAQKHLGSQLVTQGRRFLNVAGTLGTPLDSETVYDRIMGHPVFAVTTSWGSPYMSMEKLSDIQETVPTSTTTTNTPQSLSEEQNEMRMVALYFMDPNDAISVHGEMKQMDNLQNSDIRITSFSLAKALRQASNLGHGLTTGLPVTPENGQLPVSDGATLRYKVVPAKKQLYYAARCVGRERVGCFGAAVTDTTTGGSAEDAVNAVMGNSALEAANLMRRRDKRERKTTKTYGHAVAQRNNHMDGYSGIPIFYAPQLQKQAPLWKRVVSGVSNERPFFFNYEDLILAWDKTKPRRKRDRASKTATPTVEVFNLWDVLSSMDRERQYETSTNKSRVVPRVFRRHRGRGDLQSITFVPNSDSVQYKDSISRRGNGKARLPPMR